MNVLNSFRNPKIIYKLANKIKELSKNNNFRLMHVCGTHEQVINQWGLRSLLPKDLDIVAGPGCPVCCTPSQDIDMAINLASRGCIITTFGDMYRVPGSKKSLAEVKAEGKHVKIIYSIQAAVDLAKEYKNHQIVHCAIGFETTAPSTAVVILNNPPANFSIICSHKLIPPAMESLLINNECKINGFIAPGHVSTIIGSKPYEPIARKYRKPIVIAGFDPVDIFYGIFLILKQLRERRSNVEIEYSRSVPAQGNPLAIRILNKVFEICDTNWRGLGIIPNSGLQLRKKFGKYDAIKKFNVEIKKSSDREKKGCICNKILKGLKTPLDCPLFSKACSPDNPIGPCMVSVEGACNAYYKYR